MCACKVTTTKYCVCVSFFSIYRFNKQTKNHTSLQSVCVCVFVFKLFLGVKDMIMYFESFFVVVYWKISMKNVFFTWHDRFLLFYFPISWFTVQWRYVWQGNQYLFFLCFIYSSTFWTLKEAASDKFYVRDMV